jgi:hypothetical protein
MYKRHTAYKYTTDDWYPNYPIADGRIPSNVGLVRVSFLSIGNYYPPDWRVCVWGQDDCGMEKDFTSDQEDEAFSCFIQVITLEYVNRKNLEALGFGPA